MALAALSPSRSSEAHLSRNPPPLPPHLALKQALDEARFGAVRTLNLRASLPTVWEATMRAEAWLRQQQASGSDEVLVITGRGKGSAGGVSPVRSAVVQLMSSLQRGGVVRAVREHTPGSFVVALEPFRKTAGRPTPSAPVAERIAPPDPAALDGLATATRALLRDLAIRALAQLGVRSPTREFVEDEMLNQFARLVATLPEGEGREERLRQAIRAAATALDDDG